MTGAAGAGEAWVNAYKRARGERQPGPRRTRDVGLVHHDVRDGIATNAVTLPNEACPPEYPGHFLRISRP